MLKGGERTEHDPVDGDSMSVDNQREILDDLLEEIAVEHESGYDRECLLEHFLLDCTDDGMSELLHTGSLTIKLSGRTFEISLVVKEVV